ncbi:14102_t:CDS:2 [Ambispora leptoticha]|uniref:14102_t:CDS:1 n=1 Tax=Ambispora leptoticha TaxID=144679 RepID=A0A9N9EBY7_9GLOM|nr:14102_t:CDS:2 [Ambispora leptoticha]
MSVYFPTRSFQIYQTFAANTNLGKTLFSAGLLRAAATHKKVSKLFYLKPVQTGYPVDSDARFVDSFVNSKILNTRTLYSYEKPVSPHIATDKPPNDKDVLSRVKSYIAECQIQLGSNDEGKLILETAGGVNSPIMSGTLQCEFYRPLRLPTILIGDSKLGGISTTISSFEALHLRGYDIPAILLFHDTEYNNFQYLKEYFRKYDTCIHSISPPPPKNSAAEKDHENLRDYFSSTSQDFQAILKQLNEWHHLRFDRLESMEKKTMKKIWWPFTQHQRVKNVTIIDSAHDDFMITFNRNNDSEGAGQVQMKEMFDACASWWTQGLGHGSSKLSLAASYAAGRYGHVIFPECIHEPALDLAEKLLEGVGKGWATRVFYSDNGSTAIEVALKMALKTNLKRNNIKDEDAIKQATEKEFLIFGIEGSYHGDTIGAMDACGPNVYNEKVKWYKPRGYWFEAPTVYLKNGMYLVDIPKSIHPDHTNMTYSVPSFDLIFNQDQPIASDLVKIYEDHIGRILSSCIHSNKYQFGALILEPILMGAGGMKLVDPLFQRVLIDEVRKNKIPVIFDEVFTGLWRLGCRSGADLLGKKPDIATYAKLLTGGLIPLATTLTTESVFENFIGSEKTDALLHGHSYTAHPIGCSVARASLDEYEEFNKNSLHWNTAKSQWAYNENTSDGSNKEPIVWSFWDKEVVHHLSHLPKVKGVMTLGYASNASQAIVKELYSSFTSKNFGIYARPLGNVVYLMTSHITSPTNIRAVEEKLVECIKSSK